MGILLGLLAALFWGISDFLVRYSARLIGAYRTLLFMQFTGLVALGIYLIVTGNLARSIIINTWQVWAWAALVALLSTFSSLSLYRAFEIGLLLVVSPITGGYAVVTVVLSLLSGECISPMHMLGIVTVLVGAICVATVFGRAPEAGKERRRVGGLSRGVGWAVLAALGFGTAFWVLGFKVVPVLGGIIPAWLTHLIGPCVLVACAPLARQSIRFPRGRVWWYLGVISVVDTSAFVCYSFGLTLDQVAVVSVLGSLYSAITVILAWIFIREHLQWSQWVGIGVVFAGIVLVNI
jgi:drug/metabolite transporter (DMT)-like permease